MIHYVIQTMSQKVIHRLTTLRMKHGVNSQLQDAVLHTVEVNVPQAPAAADTTASRGRKRVRNIQLWQQNIRKHLCNSGKEYLDVNKTVKRAKLFAAYHCTCRFKCSENVSQKQQENIFQSFWNLGCWEKQTGFLLAYAMLSKPKKRSKGAIGYADSFFSPNTWHH